MKENKLQPNNTKFNKSNVNNEDNGNHSINFQFLVDDMEEAMSVGVVDATYHSSDTSTSTWYEYTKEDSSIKDLNLHDDYDEDDNHSDANTSTFDKSNRLTPPRLEVIGLYGRAPKSNLHLLPEDYEEHDFFEPNQYMSRRRLKTVNHKNKNNEDYTNMDQNEIDNYKYDDATFVPVRGLVNETFWHVHLDNQQGIFEDRAILFQAMEHYEKISTEPQFSSSLSSCFQNGDYLISPFFGEQVIVTGMDSSQLAVGDVFEVEGKLSSLVVEITSPRKPCYHVDKKNGTPLGLKGMKRYTLSNGLAGWFTRVLVGGPLCDGMKLVRRKHPHPKWTLTYISQVLYNEGNKTDMLACRAHWARSKDELIELINLKQLGEYEWKSEARMLLENMIKEEKEHTFMIPRLWSNPTNEVPELTIQVRGIYGRSAINVVKPSTIQKHGMMTRIRYGMSTVGEEIQEDDEEARFVPTRGLMYEKFWHSDDEKINGGRLYSDRAILFQAVEHYEVLKSDFKFSSCFNNGNYDYLTSPTFGEQVIVEGCDSSQISIGDIFEVKDKISPLVIEISSPRKAGDLVDLNHYGKSMGDDGIKQYCLTYGLAGWFARVLVSGILRDGMKLKRIKHPHPQWNIALVSNKMYKRGDIAHWDGTQEELSELMNLPQLGHLHWKDVGMKLIDTMNEQQATDTQESSSHGFWQSFIDLAARASMCYCDGVGVFLVCSQGRKGLYV